MPNLLALNDVWFSRAVCVLEPQIGINGRYWLVTNLVGAVQDAEFAATLSAQLAPLYKPALANDATFRGVGVQRRRPLPKTAEANFVGNAGAGTGGPVPLPPQTSGLIGYRSGLAGRAFRGRHYIPFPATAANMAEGSPTAAYQALLSAIGDVWDDDLAVVGAAGNATLSPVLFNRKTGVLTPISDGYVGPGWATQRRRSFYGRPNAEPF